MISLILAPLALWFIYLFWRLVDQPEQRPSRARAA